MTDRVLIPVAGLGVLALDRETFDAGLRAGAELTAPAAPSCAATEPLLDAEQAGSLLNVTARWLEDSARAEIIPHYKLGRFIRFRVSEIAAQARIDGAATDHQSVLPKNRFMTQ